MVVDKLEERRKLLTDGVDLSTDCMEKKESVNRLEKVCQQIVEDGLW